jgi:hypothetical protein
MQGEAERGCVFDHGREGSFVGGQPQCGSRSSGPPNNGLKLTSAAWQTRAALAADMERPLSSLSRGDLGQAMGE